MPIFKNKFISYYLLLEKYLKIGGESKADLRNNNFRPKLIREKCESIQKEQRNTPKENVNQSIFNAKV
jgi:hypothetical protein